MQSVVDYEAAREVVPLGLRLYCLPRAPAAGSSWHILEGARLPRQDEEVLRFSVLVVD